ncbi:MAG: FAD-binding oxidoreductase [Hyphomicrobiales bacterium]
MPTRPQNDNGCGWLNTLSKRHKTASLDHDITTKYLVIGAGYSGLSAACTLAENLPNEQIILIDANGAGEGASARNSGYLVDSTLNDGHLSDTGLKAYKQKYELNKKAADNLKQAVTRFNIDCDWNECGKYYASSDFKNEEKLQNFISLLDNMNLKNQFIEQPELPSHLGTDFYKMAVKIFSGAMIQPAALARGLIDNLPDNVQLFEDTAVQKIRHGRPHQITCPNATITAENVIVAVNGFMPSLGIKKQRAFPLLLTASLTRPLSEYEQKQLGNLPEWGVLSANHMGATLRYTADHRFMIRNTVEVSKSLNLSQDQINKRKAKHLAGLKARFAFLPDDIIEHSWAGITCISGNNANIFDEIDDRFWTIGCYNGGGIGLAHLFGHEVALQVLNKPSDISNLIQSRPKPNWLPPQPFLNWGVKIKLANDKLKATHEV